MIFVRKRDTTHSTISFSENVAVVETSYQINVKSFIILWSGEGLISSNKGNSANFSGEKKKKKHNLGCLLIENMRKNFKSNLVLVLVLESKNLYCCVVRRVRDWV